MTSDVSQLLLSKRRRIFNLALILAILGLSAYVLSGHAAQLHGQ